jgi:hypothetical protein
MFLFVVFFLMITKVRWVFFAIKPEIHLRAIHQERQSFKYREATMRQALNHASESRSSSTEILASDSHNSRAPPNAFRRSLRISALAIPRGLTQPAPGAVDCRDGVTVPALRWPRSSGLREC